MRWKINQRLAVALCSFAVGACAVDAAATGTSQNAVLGDVGFVDCPAEVMSHVEIGIARLRMLVGSTAFQECVQDAFQQYITVGGRVNIGPYKACGGDPGGTTASSVLALTRTPKDVVNYCDQSLIDSKSTAGQARGQTPTTEELTLGNVLKNLETWRVPCGANPTPNCVADSEYTAIANTVIHEIMHADGYQHVEYDDHGNIVYWCGSSDHSLLYANSIPYIVGECAHAVLDASSAICPHTTCAGSQWSQYVEDDLGRWMISGLEPNGDPVQRCTCATDAARDITWYTRPPGSAWRGPARVGTGSTWIGDKPATVAPNPDELDTFVVGDDGHAYGAYWTQADGWHNWAPLASPLALLHQSVTAVTRKGEIDLFLVGWDGRVYTSYGRFQSGFSPWVQLGGAMVHPQSTVTALARTPDVMDLFVVGGDGRVYSNYWWEGFPTSHDGRWTYGHDWFAVGNQTFPELTPISAIARAPQVIDLFAIGGDGAAYSTWWSPQGGWFDHDWFSIRGGVAPALSPITAVARRNDGIDLFVVGNDNFVYTTYWRPGDGWFDHDFTRAGSGAAPLRSEVTAISRFDQQIDLFVVGLDGYAYTTWWNPTDGWWNHSWARIGTPHGTAGAPVSAIARKPQQMDAFVVDASGAIQTAWFN